ncbi:MAG TPA: DUF3592 domain-containing protein [Thermoflexales bacterium]|nr:DUF3592 domain-containing protein [Thermoflexales bacterium]
MTEFIIFTVIFTVVLAGVGYGLQRGMRAEIAERRRARGWPKAAAIVSEAHVEQKRRWALLPGIGIPLRTQSLHRYKPVITYAYQVGGQSYQSSAYRNDVITRSGEWMSLIPTKVEQIIAEHPRGAAVTATYNPENPAQAYLVLDASEGAQRLRQWSGYVLLVAAVGLAALGAYRVSQFAATQAAAGSIPAGIPAKTEAIKAAVARDLGMTCQVRRFTGGKAVSYDAWECRGVSASGKSTYLTIYSRKQAPEIADAIHALTGETDAQKADAFFTTVASQAIPSADAQQIQDWLAKTRPTLSAQGSKATLTLGGANLVLANPNGLGLVLEIGEIK